MELRTPQEILNTLTERRQFLFNKTIEDIARQLEKSFSGSPLEVYIDKPLSMMLTIERPLKQALAIKGWYLCIGKSKTHCDGDVTALIISAIHPITIAIEDKDNSEQ